MRRTHWFGFVMLLLTLLGTGRPAAAQDQYTVTDLPIEAVAANATVARDQAIARGTETALRRVLEGLTHRTDWTLSRNTANDLVEAFELKNEQVSATRYAAAMTVRFRPALVQDLLRRGNTATIDPAAAPAAKPVLVLPVYEWAGSRVLWEDANPWRAAWARRKTTGIVPLLVPQGDPTDRSSLDAAQAVAGDTGRITALSHRYNVKSAAVIRANHFLDSAASGRPVVELTIARYGEGAMLGRPPVRVLGESNEPVDQLLDRAVGQAALLMDEAGKAGTVVPGDQSEETLVATLAVSSLDDLVRLRKAIAAVPAVRREDVASLGVRQARLRIAYVGGIERLRTALAQANLTLEQQGADWRLRSTAPAASTPAMSSPSIPATPTAPGVVGPPASGAAGAAATGVAVPR